MATVGFSPVFDDLLDFLVEKATPKEILAFKPSDSAQQRADELTEKNKSGQLSAEERNELEQMLKLDLLVTVLKARALRAMKQHGSDT